MGPTREAILAARHEGWHGAVLFVRLGPDSVGEITRVPTDTHVGMTRLAGTPGWRHPALEAFDLCVMTLAPMAGGCDERACRGDSRRAEELAEAAYPYRPESERGMAPEEWRDQWTQRAWSEALKMTRDRRVIALQGALEAAMDKEPTLSPERVREIMRRADRLLRDEVTGLGWDG